MNKVSSKFLNKNFQSTKTIKIAVSLFLNHKSTTLFLPSKVLKANLVTNIKRKTVIN